MNDVSIQEIRDLIRFSGFDIEATKRGHGLIHLFAKSQSDLTNFRGLCVVNKIRVQVISLTTEDEAVMGYVAGRVREEVSA